MKKLLTVLMIAAITMSSAAFVAANTPATTATEEVVKQEKAQDMKPQLFTGLVKQTEQGLMLETQDGVFPLTGLNLKDMVDQVVVINGVVKGEQEGNAIFVVKAALKG